MTVDLFTLGPTIRNLASTALANIRTTFLEGSYYPDMKAYWRDALPKAKSNISAIRKGLLSIDSKGTITYNYDKIQQLFETEVSAITGQDYVALNETFSGMDEESLATFLACAYIPYDKGERDLDVDLEASYSTASFYKLSPVFIKLINMYIEQTDSEVESLGYPFSERRAGYDYKELERKIALEMVMVTGL